MQPKKIAQLARELALDKKAESPVILDLSKLTSVAHYFVVLHGNSDRHVRAIANHIVDSMRRRVVELDNGRVVRDEARGVYGVGR